MYKVKGGLSLQKWFAELCSALYWPMSQKLQNRRAPAGGAHNIHIDALLLCLLAICDGPQSQSSLIFPTTEYETRRSCLSIPSCSQFWCLTMPIPMWPAEFRTNKCHVTGCTETSCKEPCVFLHFWSMKYSPEFHVGRCGTAV